MVAVPSMAAAAATSTDMDLPIVMRNKRRADRCSPRRRPAYGDVSGTGTPGFAPAAKAKKAEVPQLSHYLFLDLQLTMLCLN
jgi:hypothetical protein